jgi:tetratricopeptide (TPR) repeat protein
LPTTARFEEAMAAAEAGDMEAAKTICLALLDTEPQHAAALHLLGVVAYQTGATAEVALEMLERAIALDPSQAQFYNSHGALLYALGSNVEAEQSFRRAVELNPGDQGAWNNLGNALLRLDQVEQAETCFRQALNRAPAPVSAINNLGIALKRQGMLQKALTCFREAVRQDPDYLEAHFNLGELLYQLDDMKSAEAHFRRSLEIDPNCAPAHASLAQCLHDQHRPEESLAVLKAAVEQLPEDEDLQFALRLQLSSMVPAWHIPMINDDERNEAYERALKRAVRPDSIVLEIGTGSGLVAMMAARAGARQVVTCEILPILAEVAEETVARNGLAGRVKVVAKKSTQLKLGEDLPEKADVFVSELINIGMLAPNMLPIIRHARENLAKPDAQVIPAAAVVWGALAQCDHLARINPVRSVCGFDMAAFDRFRSPGYTPIDLAADPHRLLSNRFRALDFDFRTNMKETDAHGLAVIVQEAGLCHGVAFWFDLILDEQTVYNSASRSRTNHWKQAMQFFPQPVEVKPGDRLEIVAGYDNTRIFFNLLGEA